MKGCRYAKEVTGTVSGKAGGWTPGHQLGVEMATLVFALANQMATRTESVASEFGLTGAQARVLLQLAEPVPMGQLAERLDCNPSNVTGLVDRLHARGLVERRVSETDRRVKSRLHRTQVNRWRP